MCKVCDQANFVIETVESLLTIEDIRNVAIQAAVDQGMDKDIEMMQTMRNSDASVLMNFIGSLVAQWCEKKQLPFEAAMTFIHQHMYHRYFVFQQEEHEKLLDEKRRSYES